MHAFVILATFATITTKNLKKLPSEQNRAFSCRSSSCSVMRISQPEVLTLNLDDVTRALTLTSTCHCAAEFSSARSTQISLFIVSFISDSCDDSVLILLSTDPGCRLAACLNNVVVFAGNSPAVVHHWSSIAVKLVSPALHSPVSYTHLTLPTILRV